ncbi:MAG: glycosyltransferase family 39 protein, partial [Terriglobales bacterium]
MGPLTPQAGAARISRFRAVAWFGPPAVFLALVAAHAPLLRLPYYWDEAGYFIFAALDCFRHGWLIPRSTLANGHPPLLSLYLAGAWHVFGFHPAVTRCTMLVWAAALICGVYALARTRFPARVATLAAALVALAPLVFAQSSLALLDLPVAALVVWALVFLARQRSGLMAAALTAACLTKETAVIVPLALLLAERRHWRALLAPIVVLGLWFVYYHHATGFWFGNPQYFAYNVGTVALSPPRIALSLLRRLWQLAGYNGTWLLTVLALLGARRRSTVRMPRSWLAVLAAYLLFHAVVGGAVLARYLLPALVLYLIWVAGAIIRLPRPALVFGLCAAFLVANWFWLPPYPFPYEDNLAYAQFVRLHQAAARALEAAPPPAPVLTAWPATNELSKPELGYVRSPLPVAAVEDFSAASLARVSNRPAALYMFSRTYQP